MENVDEVNGFIKIIINYDMEYQLKKKKKKNLTKNFHLINNIILPLKINYVSYPSHQPSHTEKKKKKSQYT